jgi:hypothetical protein
MQLNSVVFLISGTILSRNSSRAKIWVKRKVIGKIWKFKNTFPYKDLVVLLEPARL